MNLAQFIQDLFALSSAALTLNANALTMMLTHPNVGWLALVLVLLAGISRLLGDSVALFINRVSPRRFVFALLGGGIMFALELALWATSIWFIVNLFGNANAPLSLLLLLVATASAPWLFGFLVFAPYLGELVRWVLRIWSWVIAIVLFRQVFAVDTIVAFIAVTLGWLVLRALDVLFASRVEKIQNSFWARFTGTPAELSFEQQADELARQLRESARNG